MYFQFSEKQRSDGGEHRGTLFPASPWLNLPISQHINSDPTLKAWKHITSFDSHCESRRWGHSGGTSLFPFVDEKTKFESFPSPGLIRGQDQILGFLL